jgi:hypothetical protein
MYENILTIAKKYLGVFGKIVILDILDKEKIDKDNIQAEGLDVIVNAFLERAHTHGLTPEGYDEPIRKDFLALKTEPQESIHP